MFFDLVTQVKLVDIRDAQFERRARIRIDLGDQVNTRQYASSVWWVNGKIKIQELQVNQVKLVDRRDARFETRDRLIRVRLDPRKKTEE